MVKATRNIPRALSVHMSMSAAYWQEGFAKGEHKAPDVQEDMHEMLRGIQAYLGHSYERDMGGVDVAYDLGGASLLRYEGHDYGGGKPVLLLLPSLINKAYILDLMEERSLLRDLCGRGVDAYLLDWESLEGVSSMDDALDVIARAAACLSEQQGMRKIHVLGYCMGGTLATAVVSARPELFASLVCLASPWDFHGGAQALTNRVKFWAPTLIPAMKDKGHMSVDWLQTLFASLDPSLAVKKFSRFAQMDMTDDQAALFVAVEDWLNDGVSLPEGLAGQCIKDWFFENAPARGAWMAWGQAVIPEEINTPVFVMASSKDKLVEFETASALADAAPRARLYDPECGHIGMIAGRDAQQKVWAPIADWVFEHEQ